MIARKFLSTNYYAVCCALLMLTGNGVYAMQGQQCLQVAQAAVASAPQVQAPQIVELRGLDGQSQGTIDLAQEQDSMTAGESFAELLHEAREQHHDFYVIRIITHDRDGRTYVHFYSSSILPLVVQRDSSDIRITISRGGFIVQPGSPHNRQFFIDPITRLRVKYGDFAVFCYRNDGDYFQQIMPDSNLERRVREARAARSRKIVDTDTVDIGISSLITRYFFSYRPISGILLPAVRAVSLSLSKYLPRTVLSYVPSMTNVFAKAGLLLFGNQWRVLLSTIAITGILCRRQIRDLLVGSIPSYKLPNVVIKGLCIYLFCRAYYSGSY